MTPDHPKHVFASGMQAKEVPHAAVGNTWASEFDSQQEAQDHEDVWRQFNGVRVCMYACMPASCLHCAVSTIPSLNNGSKRITTSATLPTTRSTLATRD